MPTCPVHPEETEFYEFPAHPSRKPRCKSCVKDGRKASSLKKAEAGPAGAPADGSAPAPMPRTRGPGKAKPGPARARMDAGWHWTWGRPPGGWKGPPSKSPDAWGPYRGMTDDEIRFRKSRRGLTGHSFGYAWLSREEWAEAERKMKERAEELARKAGRP